MSILLGRRLRARFYSCHGPTWLVAAAVHGGFLAITLLHERIPLPVLVLLGGVVIAWHGSLQHETIHGHPAGPRWVGWVLGALPLSLWLPYAVYRDTHRRHHATRHLTDPSYDPESPFQHREAWQSLGVVRRSLAWSLRTAVGRLLLGPPILIGEFLVREGRAVLRGTPRRARQWAAHLALVGLVLFWVVGIAEMSIGTYLLAFVYPGASLTLLRSFAEHRMDASPERRTTVVEASLFFRLLFLNNNFHVAHHRAPDAPWFELASRWRREREAFMRTSPDLVHSGYLGLVRRYAVRPISKVELP